MLGAIRRVGYATSRRTKECVTRACIPALTGLVRKAQHLEYDLEIEPGGDIRRIAMRFEDARKLAVEANGDLQSRCRVGACR